MCIFAWLSVAVLMLNAFALIRHFRRVDDRNGSLGPFADLRRTPDGGTGLRVEIGDPATDLSVTLALGSSSGGGEHYGVLS